MIAVYYDDKNEVWRKADSENKNPKYKWYDYCDKIWANSVTVTSTNRSNYLSADLGTEIPMNDILTMQVWIPRYKYTVWNYNLDGTVTSEPQEIDIEFEDGVISTGEILCVDSISGTNGSASETCKLRSTNENCTNSLCNGKTYTHPAFTFGEEELTGFWVGKFEVSSNVNCVASSLVDVGIGCNLKTITPLIKPNVTSWRGAMVATFENNMMMMNDQNNMYGFDLVDDTHMIKNIEWGAVAYLSHSKYGINKKLVVNSNSNYITGCGSQSEGSTSSGSICNTYNTILGMLASTTGNIYGVYDMSGGNEYVMGNIVTPNSSIMLSGHSGAYFSGYTGAVYYKSSAGDYGTFSGSFSYPDNKYYDKYSFSSSTTNMKMCKLGDAIREVTVNTGVYWYGDGSASAYYSHPWFMRGGLNVFRMYSFNGDADIGVSSRFIVVVN